MAAVLRPLVRACTERPPRHPARHQQQRPSEDLLRHLTVVALIVRAVAALFPAATLHLLPRPVPRQRRLCLRNRPR
jgi:hypothetical protein